jgi:uncharacterized membrane protein YhaH (DUF805 family)
MNSENPYQSPQADLRPTPSYEKAPERSLSLVLFSFQGRIPRRVYWGASLATLFVSYAIEFGIRTILGQDSPVVSTVAILLNVPVIWILLALQVKRWHDRDKPGSWFLINFIPLIGSIWVFVEVGCLRGTEGSNQYGPDPT